MSNESSMTKDAKSSSQETGATTGGPLAKGVMVTGWSVAKLRKEVRGRFPECRGKFASEASKATCLELLSGKMDSRLEVEKWKRDKLSATPKLKDLQEGVSGENPPPDGEHPAESLQADKGNPAGLGVFVDAIRTINPDIAKQIDALADKAKQVDELTAMRREASPMEVVGGQVRINGCVGMPKVLSKPVEGQDKPLGWDSVPAIDKKYNFAAWLAKRECGAVSFRQGVKDFQKLLLADCRIMLIGPPSVGKTSLPIQLAARCNWPVTRFNGNRDVTMQDFVGCYEARNGQTVWTDGPLVTAMKEGHVLILDEVDHMPAECSSTLHSVLESNGRLLISTTGEMVKPHANFRIVGTANTAGFGDSSGRHPNAQVQDAAFLNRFDAVFQVDWPEPSNEQRLVMSHGNVTPDEAELMVKMANDTRKASRESEILYPITMRQLIAWARLSEDVGFATAFALAVLNQVPDTDIVAVAEIAQRHFGDKLGQLTRE